MFQFHSSSASLSDAALLERFFGPEAKDVWTSCGSWGKVLELARDPRTGAWQALANALEILQRGLSEDLAERDALDARRRRARRVLCRTWTPVVRPILRPLGWPFSSEMPTGALTKAAILAVASHPSWRMPPRAMPLDLPNRDLAGILVASQSHHTAS